MTDTTLALREKYVGQLDFSKVPEALGAIIDVRGWAASVIAGKPYREPDPDFVSKMLAYQTITAETIEEAFRSQGISQLQKMIPNVPEATIGNIEITDLYVAESDFETGQPAYVIVTYVSLDDGSTGKFTTGATNVQSTILALLRLGVWPIQCKIKRGETKDKGDHYLFFMLPVD